MIDFSFSGLTHAQSSNQQYFRTKPQNVEVSEGGEVVIECEVENREGRVQWTKDGLTLGKQIQLYTRQVSSMIHSARPTVSPVANIVFA